MHEPQVPLLPEYPRLVAGLIEQTRFVHNFPDVLAKSEKDRYLFCILELLVSVFDNEKRFADAGGLTRNAGRLLPRKPAAVHRPEPARVQGKPQTHFRRLRSPNQPTKSITTPLRSWTAAPSRTSRRRSARSWKRRSPPRSPAARGPPQAAPATARSTASTERQARS